MFFWWWEWFWCWVRWFSDDDDDDDNEYGGRANSGFCSDDDYGDDVSKDVGSVLWNEYENMVIVLIVAFNL